MVKIVKSRSCEIKNGRNSFYFISPITTNLLGYQGDLGRLVLSFSGVFRGNCEKQTKNRLNGEILESS